MNGLRPTQILIALDPNVDSDLVQAESDALSNDLDELIMNKFNEANTPVLTGCLVNKAAFMVAMCRASGNHEQADIYIQFFKDSHDQLFKQVKSYDDMQGFDV